LNETRTDQRRVVQDLDREAWGVLVGGVLA
jgi:hypothetical protein